MVDEEPEEEKAVEDKKQVDGGKLTPRTQKEVLQIVNSKYNFPFFNILLYAQEHIFKYASARETREDNRNLLYSLYDKAHNLEPEPDEPELTYT